MVTFRQFLSKYGITLLPVSVASTLPGDILERKNRGYYPFASLDKIAAENIYDWSISQVQSNIVAEDISRSVNLDGKASLKSLGLNISGGLTKARSANYIISGVTSKELKSISALQTEEILQNIRKTQRSVWKDIHGKQLVELTFYAESFTIDFQVDGNVDLQAEVGDKLSHPDGSKISWSSKNSITISQNDHVPFGFKGEKIR